MNDWIQGCIVGIILAVAVIWMAVHLINMLRHPGRSCESCRTPGCTGKCPCECRGKRCCRNLMDDGHQKNAANTRNLK